MNKQFEQQEESYRSGAKETVAVLFLILSAIVFLTLITGNALLGDFGKEFADALLGIFGFSSYVFSACLLVSSVMMLFANKAKGRNLLIFSLSLIIFAAMFALEIWTSNSGIIKAQAFSFKDFIEHTYNLNCLGYKGASAGGVVMSAIIYYPVKLLSVGGAYSLSAIIFVGGALGIFSDIRKKRGQNNGKRQNPALRQQNNNYGNNQFGENFRANRVNLGDRLSDLPYQQTVTTDFGGNNLFNQAPSPYYGGQYQNQNAPEYERQKPDARSVLYPQYSNPNPIDEQYETYSQNQNAQNQGSIFDDKPQSNSRLFVYNPSKDNHLKEKSRKEVKEDKQKKAKDLLYPDESDSGFSVNNYNRPKDLSRNKSEEKRVTNESLDDVFNKNFGKNDRALSSEDYSDRRIDLINKPESDDIPSNILRSDSDDFRTKRIREYEDDKPIERRTATPLPETPEKELDQKKKPENDPDDGFRIIKPKTMPKIFTLADVKKDDEEIKEKKEETSAKSEFSEKSDERHYTREDYENNTREFKDLLASGKLRDSEIDISNIADYDYTKKMPDNPSKIKIFSSIEQIDAKKAKEPKKSFDLLDMLKGDVKSEETPEVTPIHNDENDFDGILKDIKLDDTFERADAMQIFTDEKSEISPSDAESDEGLSKAYEESSSDSNSVTSPYYRINEPKPVRTATGESASQMPIIAKTAEAPSPQKTSDAPYKRVPYNRPPIEFLSSSKLDTQDHSVEVEEKSRKLEKILASFDIGAKVVDTVVGPVVTRYELEIEEGTSVKRVEQYSKDITMGLESPSEVIIQAPIPGKNRFGVEVPNKTRTKVMMRELVESDLFENHKSSVVFALGKDVAGKMMFCDIKRMPHLLIAGSTGTGKSVCLNSILISLLYHSSPEDVRIILIDPKRVEFNIYAGLPHLLINELINDSEKAISALDWAIGEMERRFTLFQNTLARDLDSYNAALDLNVQKKLPRIIIIVDEVADLMSDNKRELEDRIKRLTQKARAAGIHLILATQRPSVDIITGVIKSNLPSRIALKVSNGIDSKTILDETGAEKLLGYGDMFYKPLDFSEKVRVQGCLVETEEVVNIVSYVIAHNPPDFDEEAQKIINTPKNQPEELSDSGFNGSPINPTQDELLKTCLKMAIEYKQISVSMIQRRTGVGYAKAGRYIDMMEKLGYISTFNGSKPREVYITKEQYERDFGEEFE